MRRIETARKQLERDARRSHGTQNQDRHQQYQDRDPTVEGKAGEA
jgi:hypothetical protein